MKRAHKRNHLIIWLVLTPVLATVLFFSLALRPGNPVNDALPAQIEGAD